MSNLIIVKKLLGNGTTRLATQRVYTIEFRHKSPKVGPSAPLSDEVARAAKPGYRGQANVPGEQMCEEDDMPEVYVYAVEGRSIEQKRSLVKDITDAVVKHFKVTPDAVMVQIMEAAKDTKAKGGVLFSDRPPA